MQYYVIGPDGSKYGPADIPTLNTWITQGRVTAQTILEDVTTGFQSSASSLPGLIWGIRQEVNYSLPPNAAQYPRNPQYGNTNLGTSELTTAWVMLALSLTCCPLIANIIGLIYANKAIALGNTGGSAARITHIVFLVLSLIGAVFYAIAIVAVIADPSLMK